MGKKNVHKLSIDLSEESSVWFAISSHENDYRLSWALNEYLGLHFIKHENFQSFHPKLNDFQEFTSYICVLPDELSYKLITNRTENGFLLEELKNIDFFIVVQGVSFDSSAFLKDLKKIPFVAAVFLIDKSTLKGKKRLV